MVVFLVQFCFNFASLNFTLVIFPAFLIKTLILKHRFAKWQIHGRYICVKVEHFGLKSVEEHAVKIPMSRSRAEQPAGEINFWGWLASQLVQQVTILLCVNDNGDYICLQ